MEIEELHEKINELVKDTDYQILIYKKDTTLYELFNKK